jgi:hypothetical protein
MDYLLDGPTPVESIEEIDSGQVLEIVDPKEEVTAKVEALPELARRIEEATKEAMVHSVGALIDACILLGISKNLTTQIMVKTLELLRARGMPEIGKI